jgi:transcriptional regulator of acetoin/glycerol metabolism
MMRVIRGIEPSASSIPQPQVAADNEEIARAIAELEILHRGICAKIEQLLRWGSAILAELDAAAACKRAFESQMRGLSDAEDRSLAMYAGSGLKSNAVVPLEDALRANLMAAFEAAGGNRAKAARMLGITRRSFLRRAKKCGIPLGPRCTKKAPAAT